MINRREARKIVMTCLYQIDICKENHLPYDTDKILKENLEIENEFVETLLKGTEENWKELDAIANKYLKKWTIDRIDKTGAAILREALYELIHMDTPPIVVINEAVELAKAYTDEELAKMLNATLDAYIRSLS